VVYTCTAGRGRIFDRPRRGKDVTTLIVEHDDKPSVECKALAARQKAQKRARMSA
jgi:hypothetical protein